MISRKHFEQLASILKSNRANDKLIRDVSNYLKTLNPRFDTDRFYQAAKPESVKNTVCLNNVKPAKGNGGHDVNTSKIAS